MRHIPCLKISLTLSLLSMALQAEVWADHQKISSNGSSFSGFIMKEMPRMFPTLQFLAAEALRQQVARRQSHSSADLYQLATSLVLPAWEVQGTCTIPLPWNASRSFWVHHIWTRWSTVRMCSAVLFMPLSEELHTARPTFFFFSFSHNVFPPYPSPHQGNRISEISFDEFRSLRFLNLFLCDD